MLAPVTGNMDWLADTAGQSDRSTNEAASFDLVALVGAGTETDGVDALTAPVQININEEPTAVQNTDAALALIAAQPTTEAGSPLHVRDRSGDADDSRTEDTTQAPAANDQVVVPVEVPQINAVPSPALGERIASDVAGTSETPKITESRERKEQESSPTDVTTSIPTPSSAATVPARKADVQSKSVSNANANADADANLTSVANTLAANTPATTPSQEDALRGWLAPVTDSVTRRSWVAELMDAKNRKPGSSPAERETSTSASLKAAPQASMSAPTAIEPSKIAVSRTADVPEAADIVAKYAAAKSVVAFQVPAAPQSSTTWDRGVTVINTATVESAPVETPVADQIVRSIRIQALLGGGEVELQLDPKYLGAVRISLKVVNDSVTAQIHADQPAVREWLDGHQQQLRDAIGEHGLKLGQLDIAKSSESQHNRDRSKDEGERHEQEPQRRRRRPAQQLPEFDLTA